MLEKAHQYIKRFITPTFYYVDGEEVDFKKYIEVSKKNPERVTEHQNFNIDEVPYIEELELTMGVDDETMVRWTKKHEDFRAAINNIKKLQKLRLMRMTNAKDKCTACQIFQLKANHGMIESEKLLVGNSNGEPLEGLVVIKSEKEA